MVLNGRFLAAATPTMRILLAAGLSMLLSIPLALMAQSPPRALPTVVLPSANIPPPLPYTAQLADGTRSGNFAVDGGSWECSRGTCRTLRRWSEPTVASCKALAAKAGQVTRFGTGKRLLAATQLAECNAGVGGSMAIPQVRAPAARSAPPAGGAIPALDKRALYEQVRAARAQAERDARARAVREQVEARNAEKAEFERRRIALGYTERRGQGEDCDDTRRDVHPLTTETCDLVDNNCNGAVDEGQTLRMFLDDDGDGHGDPARPVDVCPIEQQRAANEGRWLANNGTDCDDKDSSRWQGCR